MAGNPNLIGGGRLTRAEVSGDKRRFEGKKLNMKDLFLRLWNYIGRNRILLIFALILSFTINLTAISEQTALNADAIVCTDEK